MPPGSFASEDIVRDVERVVLGPVEDMFRVLGAGQQGTGKEFSLAIQQGGWWLFADRLAGVFGGGEDGCLHGAGKGVEAAWAGRGGVLVTAGVG